jgi:hypothetical protein
MTIIEHAVPVRIPNAGPILGWVLFEYPNSTTTAVVPCCTRFEINRICYANRDMTAVRVQLRSLMPRVQ